MVCHSGRLTVSTEDLSVCLVTTLGFEQHLVLLAPGPATVRTIPPHWFVGPSVRVPPVSPEKFIVRVVRQLVIERAPGRSVLVVWHLEIFLLLDPEG